TPDLWDPANPDPGLKDIVYTVSVIEKPGAVADYWARQIRPHRAEWGHPLSELERSYIQSFTDPSTPALLQMRTPADPAHLTPEGGGATINGRWYTEHALERMAPDTPQVRTQLRTRVGARLERLGIKPGSPAYNRVMARALEKIDPRGVPPSVVEAEILRPG